MGPQSLESTHTHTHTHTHKKLLLELELWREKLFYIGWRSWDYVLNHRWTNHRYTHMSLLNILFQNVQMWKHPRDWKTKILPHQNLEKIGRSWAELQYVVRGVHILLAPHYMPPSLSPCVRMLWTSRAFFNSPRGPPQSTFMLQICAFACVVGEGRRRACATSN